MKKTRRELIFLTLIIIIAMVGFASSSSAQNKPNILVIWGDDIGQSNISAYTRGLVGYKTPNIDRIAAEGILFTDYYGEQSCTAGRASFMLGQSVFRTGLSKVGLPGAKEGINVLDPTIAVLLKDQGYATGQFVKNHFGDRDEHLPTNHGFDEFFGNLYHLNAEEEPENEDYPKDPEFRKKFGPRGVISSTADGKIEDTGPMTRKRMETADGEFLAAGLNFIDRSVAAKNTARRAENAPAPERQLIAVSNEVMSSGSSARFPAMPPRWPNSSTQVGSRTVSPGLMIPTCGT